MTNLAFKVNIVFTLYFKYIKKLDNPYHPLLQTNSRLLNKLYIYTHVNFFLLNLCFCGLFDFSF